MFKNIKLQFPLSIYILTFIYSIIAVYFIFDAFIMFINAGYQSGYVYEVLVVTGILTLLRMNPIIYKKKSTMSVEFVFSLPVMLIYGIIPIIISDIINLFFPHQVHKNRPFFKRYYNYLNSIVSSGIAFKAFQILNNSNQTDGELIILIILIAIIYSLIEVFSVVTVIYLETKVLYFRNPAFDVFISNIMNGLITYFLYIALGIYGVIIAILYAYFYSLLTNYRVKYYQTNSELIETEQRLKTIFNTIDYGIVFFDSENKIKLANPTAINFLNRLDFSPIGKKLDELNNELPSKEILKIIDLTSKNRTNYTQKKFNVELDNKNYYFDIYTYPHINNDGNLEGLILLFKNITEEQTIRKQLVEADKLNHIGQLAAGKVHEIKNPLTTVRGYLQLLKQNIAKGDSVNIKHFDIALQELDRANEIISSLLILSKRTDRDTEKIYLDILIEEVIQLFEHQMFINNINYSKDIEYNLRIIGVENQLKQILINIMLNAIEAVTQKKSIDRTIFIKAYRKDNCITLVIEDNGIGISNEDINKLREPFFTTKKMGTGLGLSVTYKLIEEHKGIVNVESSVNKFTRFTIKFPDIEAYYLK